MTDALDFVQRATNSEPKTEQYELEADHGSLVITLEEIDRKALLDEINKLPDDMLDMLSQAEDEEEAQEMAEEQNMLSAVNGDTIEAFENIFVLSATHDGELTVHHFQDLAPKLGFEVLFEIGSRVIELSLEQSGEIKDFHEVGTDKNS